jgi:hypothetical protein
VRRHQQVRPAKNQQLACGDVFMKLSNIAPTFWRAPVLGCVLSEA